MSEIPPSFNPTSFNSTAFASSKFITRKEADYLYASINYVKNVVPGVVSAGKAVIVDSARSINNFNTISLTNSTASFVSIQTTNSSSFSSIRLQNDNNIFEIGHRGTTNSSNPNRLYIFNSLGSPSMKFTMQAGNGNSIFHSTGGDSATLANNALATDGGIYVTKSIQMGGYLNCNTTFNGNSYVNAVNSVCLNGNAIFFKGRGFGLAMEDPYHGIMYSMGTNWNGGAGWNSQSCDGPVLWGNAGVLIGSLPGGIETTCARFEGTTTTLNGRVIANGNLQSPNIRATGFSTTGWTGSGVEINYDTGSSIGVIQAYNRTSLLYRTLKLQTNLYLDTFGNVGIGTATPTCFFHVSGSTNISTGSSFGFLNNTGGTGSATGFTNRAFSARFSNSLLLDSGEINIISDVRFKENIENLNDDLVNDFIKKIDPIIYNYKNTEPKHYGYSAQELVKNKFNILVGTTKSDEPLELMELVNDQGETATIPEDTRLVINTNNIIPLLHKAIKLSNEEIRRNKLEIAELNERLNEVIDIINAQ
jgi:hypothetical protein